MKNTMVVYLTGSEYGISSYYGKIMFNGKTWKTLKEAVKFCQDNNLDYIVA